MMFLNIETLIEHRQLNVIKQKNKLYASAIKVSVIGYWVQDARTMMKVRAAGKCLMRGSNLERKWQLHFSP